MKSVLIIALVAVTMIGVMVPSGFSAESEDLTDISNYCKVGESTNNCNFLSLQNLSNADLRGADLSKANLSGADFSDSELSKEQREQVYQAKITVKANHKLAISKAVNEVTTAKAIVAEIEEKITTLDETKSNTRAQANAKQELRITLSAEYDVAVKAVKSAESALVKLMWAYGNYKDEEIQDIMTTNIAGEFTERSILGR